MHLRALLLTGLMVFAATCFGQQRVDPHFTYHRVYCVMPLTGSGSEGDPVRPDLGTVSLEAPPPGTHDGILGFHQEISDDGRWALMEIVAYDRASLAPLLEDNRPGVWVIEKGRVSREEVEAVFRKFKSSIDFDQFGVAIR